MVSTKPLRLLAMSEAQGDHMWVLVVEHTCERTALKLWMWLTLLLRSMLDTGE